MGKYCADCTNFKTSDKKVDGVCKCSKTGKYLPGNTPRCEKFGEAYSRNWYEKEKLYDDGKRAANKSSSSNMDFGTALILAGILIVIAIIANVFYLK